MSQKLLAMLVSAALLPASAIASSVIYQQGNISTSDRGAWQFADQALADDFVANFTGTLTNATWTGSYYSYANETGSESFTFNLFGSGAVPGSLLYSFIGTASVVSSATLGYFDYSLNLSGPTLNAGTEYWVSIYTNDTPYNYAWANSAEGTPKGAFNWFGGPWMDHNSEQRQRANHIFSLNGTAAVPEPATAMLAGLGLAGLGWARRRNTQKA